jgi:hypothetical protein
LTKTLRPSESADSHLAATSETGVGEVCPFSIITSWSSNGMVTYRPYVTKSNGYPAETRSVRAYLPLRGAHTDGVCCSVVTTSTRPAPACEHTKQHERSATTGLSTAMSLDTGSHSPRSASIKTAGGRRDGRAGTTGFPQSPLSNGGAIPAIILGKRGTSNRTAQKQVILRGLALGTIQATSGDGREGDQAFLAP